jgi:hypothetical protein
MSLKTIGTLGTTTLQGAQFYHDSTDLSNADFATIAAGIFRDGLTGGGNIPAILPGAFTRAGDLFIPDRNPLNPLKVKQGDWVAIDTFGNVFMIPQRALPKTLTLANCTTVNGSPIVTAPSSVTALGWQNGTHVTGTNIPNNSLIGSLAANGLSFSLVNTSGALVNATGSASNTTITAGSFTHS